MDSPLIPSVNADWTLELNVYNYDRCAYDRKIESFSAPSAAFPPRFEAAEGFVLESFNVYTYSKIVTVFGHFSKDYNAYMAKFNLKGKS